MPIDKLKIIKVKPIAENWSEYKFEDGTILRARPMIVEVEKHLGKSGPNGEPIYQIKASMVLDIKPKLKPKKSL